MKIPSLCFLITLPLLAFGKDFDIKSSENQTQLIELFTSEGCSSCPPADRWLSSLKQQPGLWTDFIPLAFHVDYWDYIGWKDPFASAQHSMRQRQHRLVNNINSVYTPGVLKSGKEWRYWRNKNITPSPQKVGTLQVSVSNDLLKGHFDNLTKLSDYQVNVAMVALDLETQVRAGENIGKKLKHDFVVIKHHTYEAKNSDFSIKLADDFFNTDHKNTAFVAWIEYDLVPIQAVGTLL